MKVAPLLFLFSFISAQLSGESAYILEKNRKEVGIFTPFKMGLNNGGEPVSYTHLTLPTNREV